MRPSGFRQTTQMRIIGNKRRPVRRILLWGLFLALLVVIPALAVHDAGMLELDGNIDDGTTPGGTEVPTDWGDLFSSGSPGGTPLALPTDATDSVFVHDESDPDLSTFIGGGSKDTNDIPNWQCTSATPSPDKNNLLHTYAVVFRPTSGNKLGSTLVYMALERFANDGDANVGFWLLQDKNVGCTSGNFTGAHVDGDLLVVAAFTNGGAVAGVDLYQWSAGSLVGPITTGVDCAMHLFTITFITALAVLPYWSGVYALLLCLDFSKDA